MSISNFNISILSLHWLENIKEETDLCAHGQVKVRVGTEIVVDKSEQDTDHWTLSAMALHLLRTLESNHEPGDLVGEHLIPCCGHHIDHIPGSPKVHILGCFNGHNFWVRHNSNSVDLKTETGNSLTIGFDEYKNEILRFVDAVKEFYDNSKTKELPEDEYDRTGYLMFWNEWNERRNKW